MSNFIPFTRPSFNQETIDAVAGGTSLCLAMGSA
jgi:hypothetical protein